MTKELSIILSCKWLNKFKRIHRWATCKTCLHIKYEPFLAEPDNLRAHLIPKKCHFLVNLLLWKWPKMRFLEKMFFILICNPVLIKSNEPNIRIRRFDEMFVVNMAKLCIVSPLFIELLPKQGSFWRKSCFFRYLFGKNGCHSCREFDNFANCGRSRYALLCWTSLHVAACKQL